MTAPDKPKCTNPRCGIEFPLKDFKPENGTVGFCPVCLKFVWQVEQMMKHVEKHGINKMWGPGREVDT